MKCSFYTTNLCLTSSKENTLGVRKYGKIYGSWVNPYTLMMVCSSNRNRSLILLCGTNCKSSYICGNTLRNLFWKNILKTSSINKFIYLEKLVVIYVVSTISRNYIFSSLKNRNILIEYDWNKKFILLCEFTSWEWILSARNSLI